MTVVRKQEVAFEFQGYAPGAPVHPDNLYQQACRADKVTVDSWRQTWIDHVRANRKTYGSFAQHSIGKLYNRFRNLPVIVAGSGPSLKYNANKLKDRGNMGLVSCLHNFHYLEDIGANVDCYVTLDAGPVTIEEVWEGGSRTPEEYWAATEKRTLLCFVGTHPDLLAKWRGEVLFFNAPVPDEAYLKAMNELEPFHCYVSNGGNVLGASMYISRAFMGGNPIIYVGADMAFSDDVSDKTGNPMFHAWNSKYDAALGNVVAVTSVFGHKLKSWPSYTSFKSWFEYVSIRMPGIWINATEGGCLGAYPEGNLPSLRQMTLDQVYEMYSFPDKPEIRAQALNPETAERRVLI